MLDTRTVPDGRHTLQLALIDVAGNRGLTSPTDVNVRNGPPASPPSSPAAARPGTLTVARKALRARHNRAAVVTATLRDTARAPIAGAPVTVAVRTNVRGSRYASPLTVFSDSKGAVTLRLPPGPSRIVRMTYGDSAVTVTVKVKAPLRLSVTPKSTRNRGTVRLTGSVAGTRLPTRIELQAFSGGHWFPFKTVALRKGKSPRATASRGATRPSATASARCCTPTATSRTRPRTSPVVAVRVRP